MQEPRTGGDAPEISKLNGDDDDDTSWPPEHDRTGKDLEEAGDLKDTSISAEDTFDKTCSTLDGHDQG